jgi:hypothetical protein
MSSCPNCGAGRVSCEHREYIPPVVPSEENPVKRPTIGRPRGSYSKKVEA